MSKQQRSCDELMALHVDLKKCVADDESGDKSNVKDILTTLTNTRMTVSLLQDTKLGQTVAKLRKHDNSTVATLAKTLLKDWKLMAKTSPRNSTTTTSVAAPIPPKPTTSTTTRKVLPMPVGLSAMRHKVVTKYIEVLSASESSEDTVRSAAVEIEASMSQLYKMHTPHEDKREYASKFRQLKFNLTKNTVLASNVLSNTVNGSTLVQMTAEELATDERRAQDAKLRDDAFQKSRLDWDQANEEKINKQCGITGDTGLFTCGRCKSTKTSNTQKQTRSADEPMTVFVLCQNCGNRWKC